MNTRVINLGADDPTDPVEILREKWKTARGDIGFCCETLADQIMTPCNHHGFDCPDYLIQIGITGFQNPRAFWCGAAGNATYEVKFCPWCGSKLPELKNLLDKQS